MKKDFKIIGAGVSGLTLAYELLKKGETVKIYESTDFVGGLASTLIKDNIPFDCGPHLFHSAHEEIIEYWRDLVGDDLVEKQFFAGNFVEGKFYDYPINKETIKDQYLEEEIETILYELSDIDEEKLASSSNYSDYVTNLCGPFLAEKFFKKYPEKLWGLKTDDLSARFAPRRIEIRDTRRPFHSGEGKFAGIIEGGCGVISNVLKEKIEDLGGVINFNSRVTNFYSDGDGRSISVNSLEINNSEVIDVRNSIIISTLPLNVNARLANIDTNLYFRSCMLINIVIKGEDPFPSEFDWLYFGSEDVPFHRVGMQSRFSRKGLDNDMHIMCCEISYTEKPSDKKILKWEKDSIEYLVKNNLIKKSKIFSINIHDAGPVYPGYFGGHEEEVSKVNSELGRLTNYYLLGSLAEYAYSDLQVLTAKAIDLAQELSTSNKKIKSEIIKDETVTLPSSYFKFGNELISSNKIDPVFIIAEIGLCHNGSVDICKKLILASKKSGFNAAKIQTYVPGRISKKTRTSRYYEETLDAEESISSMLDRIIFSNDELTEIFSYAKEIQIELFSTPFDAASVELLENQNVSGYKISSMDLVNAPLIREVCKTGKPVILSTGMASMSHIENALSLCLSMGVSELSVLHCVSSYPCPLEMANLSRIKRIGNSFGVITGFSDHTLEIITPSLAVALGARVIEKHVTLGKDMDGPDHNFSLVPVEMKEMVALVRKTEKSLISHQMDVSSSELSAKQNLRRSIYAAKEIKSGERLNHHNLVIKSPGDGIPADQYDFLLDKELKVGIEEDFPIKWENLFD